MPQPRPLKWLLSGLALTDVALMLAFGNACSLSELYGGGSGGGGGTPAAGCPTGMIEIPPALSDSKAFCIDALETTNKEYAAFMAAVEAGTPVQKPDVKCDWNTDVSPQVDITSGDQYPVAGINWCDAYAYCAWAGKRLCGAVGGGRLEPTLRDTSMSQWYLACSNWMRHPYPYGTSYDATKCAICSDETGCDANLSTPDAGHPTEVGSHPDCVGGFPGLMDMSGNIAEWEDSCLNTSETADASTDPKKDDCAFRGGGFLYPHSDVGDECLGCATCGVAHKQRNDRTSMLGVRCCKDL